MYILIFTIFPCSSALVKRLGGTSTIRVRHKYSNATHYIYILFLNKLNHRSTNTDLVSTTSAPRGGDITDKKREVRAGRRQGSRPSGHARTKDEAR